MSIDSCAETTGSGVPNEPRPSLAKKLLKAIRASQPFNCLATNLVRLACCGSRPEWVIKHLHRVGHVRSKLPNGKTLRLWSRGDDWISNQVFWRGWHGYEPETTPLFFQLASKAAVTLDIGAHVGFFSLLAAHANPAGRVFAFEPLPPVNERLRLNLSLNGIDNVTCQAAAVGDVDGEAEFFHVPEGLPSSSSLSFSFMSSGGGLLKATRVPVITLDRFVREQQVPRVDLVKIDTESTEPQVLHGMFETLRRDRPNIVCEILKGRGTGKELSDILRPLGYRFHLLTPTGLVEHEQPEGHTTWLNYLFSVDRPERTVQR